MRTIQFDFPVDEITYKVIGERQLKLNTFWPELRGLNRTAILFFNGGSFKKGPLTPAQFQHQARYFASIGIVSMCVDYRNGYDERFTPLQAISDAKSAVHWIRNHAEELGIHPDQIVMCGASAGGYTAVSSIMFKSIMDDQSVDHVPNALVVFAAGMDAVNISERLFPQLVEQAKDFSPIHRIQKCLPPTLWMCGTSDELFQQNSEFVTLMQQKGNDITFVSYEGMGHGFFNYGWHENKPYNETTQKIEEYLKTLRFM
ncbi:alpha/beta hydrolase [Paenibacillus gansuensis]|uniref:Alpha/beta hydrolase n=1 Tax=Paenibacillus gansuensis TaxID=306542 RepID=A0ABW5PKA8_9BACL